MSFVVWVLKRMRVKRTRLGSFRETKDDGENVGESHRLSFPSPSLILKLPQTTFCSVDSRTGTGVRILVFYWSSPLFSTLLSPFLVLLLGCLSVVLSQGKRTHALSTPPQLNENKTWNWFLIIFNPSASFSHLSFRKQAWGKNCKLEFIQVDFLKPEKEDKILPERKLVTEHSTTQHILLTLFP